MNMKLHKQFQMYLLILLTSHYFDLTYSQTCPSQINNPSVSCTKIERWSDLAIATKSGSSRMAFCPFDIEKPATANSFLVFKPLTMICREDSKCIINVSPFERNGVIKINEPGNLTMRGFVFQSKGSFFNMISVIHVKFATSRKQLFCQCTFSG